MHSRRLTCLLLPLGLFAASARAQTIITIDFDEIASFSLPAEQFAGLGVHFGAGPIGVLAGISNGDPGSWGLDGTNGPYFLGFNGPYQEFITFDFSVASVSLKVSRSNGSGPADTFALNAYNGATLVDTQTTSLLTINSWTTVTVGAANITRIELNGIGLAFHPYGVDHLQITPVPEPAMLGLLALGVGALGLRHRRIRRPCVPQEDLHR